MCYQFYRFLTFFYTEVSSISFSTLTLSVLADSSVLAFTNAVGDVLVILLL